MVPHRVHRVELVRMALRVDRADRTVRLRTLVRMERRPPLPIPVLTERLLLVRMAHRPDLLHRSTMVLRLRQALTRLHRLVTMLARSLRLSNMGHRRMRMGLKEVILLLGNRADMLRLVSKVDTRLQVNKEDTHRQVNKVDSRTNSLASERLWFPSRLLLHPSTNNLPMHLPQCYLRRSDVTSPAGTMRPTSQFLNAVRPSHLLQQPPPSPRPSPIRLRPDLPQPFMVTSRFCRRHQRVLARRSA